jgi:hypothetical protein
MGWSLHLSQYGNFIFLFVLINVIFPENKSEAYVYCKGI